MNGDALDPKALIREAYRIEGITGAECRSIFLDWALSLPDGADSRALLQALLERYSDQPADHPMSVVLRQGLSRNPVRGRRGGRNARMV